MKMGQTITAGTRIFINRIGIEGEAWEKNQELNGVMPRGRRGGDVPRSVHLVTIAMRRGEQSDLESLSEKSYLQKLHSRTR